MNELISTMRDEAVALLQRMIAIPSTSRDETRVADMIAQFIADKGYEVRRKGNNVWTQAPEREGAPVILLNSHLDTVKPVSSWTRDPFQPVIEDGKLYGLGSNDAGASVVSIMQAFFYLAQLPSRSYNLRLAITAEEEVTGKGGISLVLDDLLPLDLVIVGEPTQLQMGVAEHGLMVLDGIATGKTGHAARNEGENALYKALDDIAWFRNYTFPKESDILGKVKMSVTMIQAGYQHNVVPDKCTYVVDVRTNEFYTNEQALAIIRDHLHASTVTPRSTHLNSSSIPLSHPIIRRGQSLGLKWFGSPTTSDQARIPYPSFKMGPGCSERSHTANEYVCLSEIEAGIKTYIHLLKDFSWTL